MRGDDSGEERFRKSGIIHVYDSSGEYATFNCVVDWIPTILIRTQKEKGRREYHLLSV